jgi:hypothetical protein
MRVSIVIKEVLILRLLINVIKIDPLQLGGKMILIC